MNGLRKGVRLPSNARGPLEVNGQAFETSPCCCEFSPACSAARVQLQSRRVGMNGVFLGEYRKGATKLRMYIKE